MFLEACVGNLQEALIAEKLGAHQIELCDRLDLDGTSPPISTIKSVCNHLSIPIKVIVNPNPFEYNYSDEGIQKILNYINQLNELSIKGIVFGPITQEGYPDLKTIETIANNTELPITYHKAIDNSQDILKSTKLLVEQDIVKFILSSGSKSTALNGVETLTKMQSELQKSEIQLIGAGKITSQNLPQLHEILSLSHYHGKKIVGDLSNLNKI